MLVLVEFNKNFEEIKEECIKQKLIFIPIFTLNLTSKEEIQTQLKVIKEQKNNLTYSYCAIRVIIYNFSNSLIGTINSLKQEFDLVIGFGGLNKINRFFLEQTQIDFLEDPQNSQYKVKIDFIHHFNSGLNHVLCKLAKEKNIGIIHSLSFRKLQPFFISKEIGRINQNVKFARKYKIPITSNIISNKYQIKNKFQLKQINSILGFNNDQNKQALSIIEEKIKQNQFKKSDKFIGDGVWFE